MAQPVDVVIVGGGPAGLTAALYTARRTLNTVMITKDIGGQLATTPLVENYPGIDAIDGLQLSLNMQKQAEKYGAKIVFAEVKQVQRQRRDFLIETANETFQSKAVILTFGVTPRKLQVPGEEIFAGKGVTYCATCDAPLYKNKVAAVVGGGNAALEAVEILSRLTNKVYLIHRRDQFRAEQITIDKVKADPKVEMKLWNVVKEIKGDRVVRSVVLEHTKQQTTEDIPVDGVFIEIGRVVQSEWIKNLVEINDAGEIVCNPRTETRTPGVFAAGDVTHIAYKQVVSSAGQGCIAALSAYEYLVKLSGGTPQMEADWTIMRKDLLPK